LENEEVLYSINISGNNNKVIIEDFDRRFEENWTVSGPFIYYPKLAEQRGIWQYRLLR